MKRTILGLTVVGFLIGCGSGGSKTSSTQGDGSDNDLGNQPSISWKPVTSNFTCDPKAVTFNGTISDTKYAAEGDIKVECQTSAGYERAKYSLVGVESMEVTGYTKIERISGYSDKYGSFSSVETSNFKTGEHRIKGTSKILNIDCVEKYQTMFPITVDADGLDDLLDLDFDMVVRIDTTCPSSYYDEKDTDNDNIDLSLGSFVHTIDNVITDSSGKSHKTSSERKASK